MEKLQFIKLKDIPDPTWKIKKTDSSIIIYESGHAYEIEKSRCDTPKKVCHWVCHLSGKNWVTPEILREFVLKALGNDVWYW